MSLAPLAALLVATLAAPPESKPAPAWSRLERGSVTLEYTEADAVLVPKLETYVDTGRRTVQTFFGRPFARPFVVRVFPDRASLTAHWRAAWKMPDLKPEAWMVASGVGGELSILSPRVWKTQAVEHDPANETETQRLITHELVHVFHGQANPRPNFDGMDDLGWFVEGVAVFASEQLNAKRLAAARRAVSAGKAPKRLADVWSGRERYGFAGSIVSFIDRTYGRDAVERMLRGTSQAELLAVLGISEETLLTRWKESLTKAAPKP